MLNQRKLRGTILLFLLGMTFLFGSGFIFLLTGGENDDSKVIEEVSDGISFQMATSITSFDGRIAGIGLPANITLDCNKSGGPSYKASDSSLDISVPVPWTITYTNITVLDVIQDSATVIVEDSIATFEDTQNAWYAMQFNVSTFTLLENFSVYVHDIKKVDGITVRVYNATLQGSDPAPDTELFNQAFGNLGDGEDNRWHNFILSSATELDPTNTYGNAFFIAVFTSIGPGGTFEWGSELDSSGDDGAAYSPGWTLESWDFDLKVEFVNISRSPSEIELKINATSVNDKNINDGEWISTSVYSDISGLVSFEFSANVSAHFLAKWFVSYHLTANQVVNTYFEGFDTDEVIYWNATYGAAFIADSFDKRLEFDLPNWNFIMNVRENQSIHTNWNSSIIGSIRKVTIRDAENALWTIQCNDTNYVETIYAKRLGTIISEINSTDTIEIFGNLTEILTTGDVNLTIFPIEANYNDTVGETITSNKSIKFSPAWRPNDTASASYTQARLQVSWFNGTAAGINTTILTVNNIPTNLTYLNHTTIIESGDSIYAYVNFSSEYTGKGLADADLLVKNSTDDTTWPAPFSIIQDYLNGTYKIEILSLGIGSGQHNFSINLSKPLYLSSEISDLSVTVGGGVSNVSVTAPSCVGLDRINKSYALTNPAPYHNSSVRVSIYYYDDVTLAPLSGAIITSSWIGGGPTASWANAFFGYYNITIDVTGFHAGTNHTLRISIQEGGYGASELYIIVPIRKLPTTIQPFESSYAKYLEDTFIVYTVFQDTFNEQSIPSVYELSGNFTIQIGNLVDNMTLLVSDMGIYLYELTLSTLGLEEGSTYNITLYAYSSEHEFALVNVSIYIIPKAQVELKLIGVPTYVLAGTQLTIYANLTLTDGTPIYSTPLIFTMHYEPGAVESQNVYLTNGSGIAESLIEINPIKESIQIKVEYQGNITVQNRTTLSAVIPIIILNSSLTLSPLPDEIMQGETLEVNATLLINGSAVVGKFLVFTFTYEGSSRVDVRTAGTNAAGTASVGINVPSDVSRIYVSVSFEGSTYETPNSTSSQINVISIMTLVWRYSPIWLSIIALMVVVAVTYKYGYKRKKLNRLRAKWQIAAQKFSDAANLNFLMVVLRKTGASIFNYSFKGEELDFNLMSGCLTAISTFQAELLKLDKKEVGKSEEWALSYHKYKIYGVTRELVQLVLILEETPSEQMKEALLNFGRDIELVYTSEFKKYTGDLTAFEPIISVVPKYFETELTYPHVIEVIDRKQYSQLSQLERKLYILGRSFTKEQGYFFFSTLIESALMISNEERDQILDAIYKLVATKYFKARTTIIQKSPTVSESVAQVPPKIPKKLNETLQKILQTAQTAEKKQYFAMALEYYEKAIPILEEMHRNDLIADLSIKIEELKKKIK